MHYDSPKKMYPFSYPDPQKDKQCRNKYESRLKANRSSTVREDYD